MARKKGGGILIKEEFLKQLDAVAAKHPDLPDGGDKVAEIPRIPRVSITLCFYDDADLDILDFVNAEAKRCRRTPDQQIMWTLQSHLPEIRGEVAA
ncbi:MAG TPA: hypothetical protein PLG18_11010 [Syntrophales bacterium]|nr:hypothetical protein [Syntrophales bacterium]